MKKSFLTLVLVVISIGAFAQDFEIPKGYKFKKAEDYYKYEKDILRCIDWLMKTPLSEQTAKRKEANAFFIKWVSGSKDVHIEIKPNIVNFLETSPDLLAIFLGGWAKYALENDYSKDKVAVNLAGIEAVMDFYTKNQASFTKDKNIEKYIKLKNKGTLKDYISKKI